MEQPSIYRQKQQTWANYKADILKILIEGLSLLRANEHLVIGEVNLNRELFFCFKRAAHKLKLNYLLPVPEANNPPYEDDEQRTVRENKRPDFLWQFYDDSVDDPKYGDRHFILECKCLGKPRSSSPTWILNQNYIQHGIARFLTTEYEYAKGDESGAMVGFVESMEFEEILCEVNSYITACKVSIPMLTSPIDDWQQNSISHLEHSLIRTFPHSPFLLHHFWLDIRDRDLRLPEPTKKNFTNQKNSKQKSTRGDNKRQHKKIEKQQSNQTQPELPLEHAK